MSANLNKKALLRQKMLFSGIFMGRFVRRFLRRFVRRFIRRFLRRLLRLITAFSADTSGVTMTEFVLTLPVVLVIFSGILTLGKVGAVSVQTWSVAHANTFDSFQDEKMVSDLSDIPASLDLNDPGMAKLLPPLAGASALNQLRKYPVPQESHALRNAVVAAEVPVYSKLSSDGHLGELEGRLQPLHRIGGFNYFGVSSSAVSPNTYQLMGIPGRGGSQVGSTLVYDGPSNFTSNFGSRGCDEKPGLLEQAAHQLQDALGAGGIRPMLAAGLQYGTITGKPQRDIIDMGPNLPPVIVNAYYNVTMPPRVMEAEWAQPALTTVVSRMALEDCALAPYSHLLRIRQGSQQLPSADKWKLDGVLGPNEAGIRHPLTYGGPEL